MGLQKLKTSVLDRNSQFTNCLYVGIEWHFLFIFVLHLPSNLSDGGADGQKASCVNMQRI